MFAQYLARGLARASITAYTPPWLLLLRIFHSHPARGISENQFARGYLPTPQRGFFHAPRPR